MARPKNQEKYSESRDKLIEVGMTLFRENGYEATGINEILKVSGLPKGSFYHYFATKEAFGLAVAEAYHEGQLGAAREIFRDESLEPNKRMLRFFERPLQLAIEEGSHSGCLMCNLSTELGAKYEPFRLALARHWQEITGELAEFLDASLRSQLGLEALTPQEAADHLLNAWSGALVRMKADGNPSALKLFFKTMLNIEGSIS